MRNLLSLLYREVAQTIERPKRIVRILNKKKLYEYFRFLSLESRISRAWVTYNNGQGLRRRSYSSYEDYLMHQKDKLRYKDLYNYDLKFRSTLRERLENLDISWPNKTVLCLAARIGTEVKSFLDLGCFAIGIDLNPGENNRYVVYGDFHDIQFPSHCVDVVFTNSLDHAFTIEKMVNEIRRVLKPQGLLIVEAARGDEGSQPGFYESFWWSKTDNLVSLLESFQFRLIRRSSYDYPWDGEQLIFE